MTAGLLFLTFFALHGTSGNQTENGKISVKSHTLIMHTALCLLTQNHISLIAIGVAAVGTLKNYVIVTGQSTQMNISVKVKLIL